MTTPATLPQLTETVLATQRYLEALTVLGTEDLRRPSALPSWTRAHVVAHLARNADAFTQVLGQLKAGDDAHMYASSETRDADIEATLSLDATGLCDDCVSACAAFAEAAWSLDPSLLESSFRRTPGTPGIPVSYLAVMRRTEVEIHHTDLDIGYSPRDWPTDFTLALIKRRQDELAEQPPGGPSMVLSSTDLDGLWKLGAGQGPEIEGLAGDLAWWLVGRGDGSGLVSSAGELPKLPRWR